MQGIRVNQPISYVATWKHLATECKFGEAMPNESLHDHLVLGIRDSKIITELLKVKFAELSFNLAVQKCLAVEQANKDVQVLQGEQELSAQVHKLNLSNQRKPKRSTKYLPTEATGFAG